MCEVEEESKQGGRFRRRKEDEATLEDPVQEESDSKSESHVIEAFLTDGHNSKPLSCGKESILARMALWMLSFSWPCLIPLSDTYMMLVLAMHCAVLLVGPSVHPHIRKKGESGVLAQWRPCKYRTTTSWLCASLKIFPTSPTLWPQTRCPAPPLTSHASHAFQSHCQEVRHCGQRQDILTSSNFSLP